MALALIVNFTVAEANLEEAKRLIAQLEEHTRREPGCVEYRGHQSTDDPCRFVFYELYRDQAALDAHRATPHYAKFAAGALVKMMATRITGLFNTLS